MFKRFLVILLYIGAISAASGQVTVEGSNFTDNWSVGVSGGVVTPMKHHPFWGDSRGLVDINLHKSLTPAFGLGTDFQFAVNTSSWFPPRSLTAIDHSYLGVYASLNLMNAFAGYTGTRRYFEMELTAGTGWIHSYSNIKSNSASSWGNKLGMNFNFNLGKSKAWTIAFKPAILWNMGAKTLSQGGNLPGWSARYNANAAVVELMAGVTYHFANSNGTHSFVNASLYDPTEIEELKRHAESLGQQLENSRNENNRLSSRANKLQNEIDACARRPQVVKEITENLNNVRYIFFSLGSASIQNNQQPNLELIANSVKNIQGATIEIKGYASPEGSSAFNRQLSKRRAEAVKNELIRKYHLNPERITTEGKGVGEIFNVASWNRVAVCTINKK